MEPLSPTGYLDRNPRHLRGSGFRCLLGSIHRPGPDTVARSLPMLDIAYLVIGGLFLGAFVLYALACDRL
jgi:hypothetical protein